MSDNKKFLDQEGVKYLWSQLSLEDYPNNEVLMAVLQAIDDTKKNKPELFTTYESPLVLKDCAEYRLSNVSTLTFVYPETETFEVWLKITCADSDEINIGFPADTQYIGEMPVFASGQVWEISIKDKVAVCWRVE